MPQLYDSKRFPRILCMLLSVAMGAAVFSGCSSGQEPAAGQSTAPASQSAEQSAQESEAAASQPVNEKRRTLKIEMFDRGVTDGDATADNNYSTDYIKENFGERYNADVEFVLVPRKEETDKLSVLMASNSAPDICFTYDRDLVFQFATQGGLTELDEYYASSPTLQAYQGDNINYGKCNDKIIAIPGRKKHTIQHSGAIRKDWLDKVGMDVPTNTDEWYAVMKAFKEQDPGGFGDKNYPYLLRAPGTTEVNMLIWSFVDPDMTDEQNFTLPYLLLPGWQDGMRFLNQMYNEGLINPEFALDKNDTMYNQAISTGAWGYGIHLTGTFMNSEQAKTMYKNIPESETLICYPFENAAGEHKKAIYPTYSLFNFVPKASKVPDLAMQYFEWLAEEENAIRLVSGIEGIHWKLDEQTGLRTNLPDNERPAEWQGKKTWGGIDIYILDAAPDMTLEKEATVRYYNELNGYSTIDKQPDEARARQVAEQVKYAHEEGVRDSFIDLRDYPNYERPLESVSKYQNNLNKIYDDGFVKIVTAAPDQFDAVYRQITDQYLQSGGQAIIDEKTEHYKELHP